MAPWGPAAKKPTGKKEPEKDQAVEQVLSITVHASYLKSISDDASAMRKYIEKNFAFESSSDANFKLVELKRILVDAECYEVAIIIRDYVKENAKGVAEPQKPEVETVSKKVKLEDRYELDDRSDQTF